MLLKLRFLIIKIVLCIILLRAHWIPFQIKTVLIHKAVIYSGIQLFDVNEDGLLDLVLAVSSIAGEVWVYEILSASNFRLNLKFIMTNYTY